MSLINFTNLDFNEIKTTLRDYIQSNSDFTDYDFEGSNLSTILDVLAYNTYITSYNANMISNEVFIDSATLRENVVALARNIGYVPRSRKASRASVNFFVDISSVSPTPANLTLKAGPVASTGGSFNNQSFVFGIPEDITVSVIDGIASFDNIELFEGSFLTQTYVYSSRNPFQKFILPNIGIDLDSLVVSVRPSVQSSVTTKYSRQDELFDSVTKSIINKNSNIYFIQEVEGEQYEVIFGDGVFGKALEDGNVVEMSYIVSSGSDGNGVSSFSFAGSVSYVRNSVQISVTSGISLITPNSSSSGGESIESIDSIRKYAPQVYTTQNRALSANDYEILIPNKIYPEAESVSVFGGEELVPPQYGKVFISIKPRNGDFVPNLIKENIKRDLRKYSVAGIVPEILDLKYLFIETNSKVYYNTNLAPSASFVSTKVQRDLTSYAESSELNKYGARFKYSRFLKVIDSSHESVTSNITTVEMRRDLRLATSEVAEYAIGFGNEFHVKSMNGFNIRSSAFRVLNINTDVYLYDIPDSTAEKGQISLFSLDEGSSTPVIQRRNVGVIDYKKGRITLDPINIVSGKTKDNVDILEISASTYTVTTSYKNGNIIR